MTYAVVVDWYGPYDSVKAAKAVIREWDMGEVLYMAAGTVDRQTIPKLQYVGITKGFEGRMRPEHKVRTTIAEEGLSIYLGEVSSQAVSGRKAGHHHKRFTVPVYLAESALAFFLQLPLNSDKRCSRPKDSIVLLNRWWKADGQSRSRRRPHPDWPDFIEYDDESDVGSVVWHGKRRKHFNAELIDETCARASKELRAERERAAAA
ncbi:MULTISPECIES: hypothetical protein [unclassified Sphingobium]|uniref:hypothetical protein n=1 Tax=unclassified Sphingobium TaxID=2611147 RepID=UPI000B497012|nr:hypothetical protein [Sphingobium sp. Z007]